MKNEYFTPEISDIRIGYECEIKPRTTTMYVGQGLYGILKSMGFEGEKYQKYFKKTKINNPSLRNFLDPQTLSFNEYTLKELIEDSAIRVPYLTKEQIEAEGWSRVDDGFPIQKFKHPTYITMEVIYNYDTHHLFITIPSTIIYTNPPINYRGNNFSGECRCINDFRLICKLLKIN